MPGKPTHLNHPIIAYFVGLLVLLILVTVLVGIGYNVLFSPRGPELLARVKAKLEQRRQPEPGKPVTRQEEMVMHRHFHNPVELPQWPEYKRTECLVCHSELPHNSNEKVRGLINMHTQFLMCETCHVDTDIGQVRVHRWVHPIEDAPQGPFFGTRYDPQTGNLAEVSDRISRIAPFSVRNGQVESLLRTKDTDAARDFMRAQNQLNDRQKKQRIEMFHHSTTPKGQTCERCHTRNGLLDYSALGFAANRIDDLEQLSIKGMITKYEEFYLPNLFK